MSAKDTSVLCREVMSITDTMDVLRNNGQDDVSTYDYHNLLDNLLIACKWLIHIYIEKAKTAKWTNWEQKFQNPKNENICLTNLNTENESNFPILAFWVRHIRQIYIGRDWRYEVFFVLDFDKWKSNQGCHLSPRNIKKRVNNDDFWMNKDGILKIIV